MLYCRLVSEHLEASSGPTPGPVRVAGAPTGESTVYTPHGTKPNNTAKHTGEERASILSLRELLIGSAQETLIRTQRVAITLDVFDSQRIPTPFPCLF